MIEVSQAHGELVTGRKLLSYQFIRDVGTNGNYPQIVNGTDISLGGIQVTTRKVKAGTFLQRCFWEYLQLSVLHNDNSILGDTIGHLSLRDLPPQELALFGRAIFEDLNQMCLP